ncbi:MAG: hypothetical protein U9Q66_04315 [Patescibacteria group bacterium]|nr:hypothetical protein [Patescibacteria group bacterium]
MTLITNSNLEVLLIDDLIESTEYEVTVITLTDSNGKNIEE